jgi:hypothetical protein
MVRSPYALLKKDVASFDPVKNDISLVNVEETAILK